jgi:hypothetical protein
MIINRWSFSRHVYDPVDLPDTWHVVLSSGPDELVNCPECGTEFNGYFDGYTSFRWHTVVGFGYTVCPDCYKDEFNERLRHRSLED